MRKREIAIVMDCGSTNITVSAIDGQGKILHSASSPNQSHAQAGKKGWYVWDLEEIWHKLCLCSRIISKKINKEQIKAVTLTSMGADGTLVDKKGNLLYPPISWQCPRTKTLTKEITKIINPGEIFKITGYQIISFNTLLRLLWFRKTLPHLLDKAYKWMMMPGLISHKLCAEFSLDPTSGSTMMAMDLGKRDWSKRMLKLAGVDFSLFPSWIAPGEIIGKVHKKASKQTGLPQGIPVIATGHDTQFAPLGCGAKKEEAILSSGTWEILMFRVNKYTPNKTGYEGGLIIEADAQKGYWNPQLLMIGSAVLEWVRKNFYASLAKNEDIYSIMIAEAEKVSPAKNNIMFIPSFVSDTGPFRKYKTEGTMLGLKVTSGREEIYRAALEGLCFQLRRALEILQASAGYRAKGLRVIGGGAKNRLWNQLRAEITGLPVTTVSQQEATAIGAAMFCFLGAGIYKNIEEARNNFSFQETLFTPTRASKIYAELYRRYIALPATLEKFYRH